ncbi:MAG: hypothetical protein ISQ32_04785 [Rickettsiales bacterium]|nr:hypothetical protein [Rickettsiales bacterium]
MIKKLFIISTLFFSVSFSNQIFANDRVKCIKENGKICFNSDHCDLKSLSFSERKRIGKCKDAGGEISQCIVSLREFGENQKSCLKDCFEKKCPK